jgi:hypothetical protein
VFFSKRCKKGQTQIIEVEKKRMVTTGVEQEILSDNIPKVL